MKPHVLKGATVGSWTVVGPMKNRKHPRLLCECRCGARKWVLEIRLRRGESTDCGCINKKGFIDLKGRTFGSWFVLGPYKKGKNTKWLCQCKCGYEGWINGCELKAGRSTSCFCEGRIRQRKAVTKPDAYAAKMKLYIQYKNAALRRGFSFSLSFDQFVSICARSCAYCGLEPSQVCAGKGYAQSFTHSGIDRVDSSRGYDADNSLPCCKTCNYAKHQMSIDEFRAWIERVHSHQFTYIPATFPLLASEGIN